MEGAFSSRPSESIQVTILRLRNLRGNRGDVVASVLRLEFAEQKIGESIKQEYNYAEAAGEFNFTVEIPCRFDDLSSLDEIANKPVILSVEEYLPKEKKQKEEKKFLLAQCSFDLFALLKGQPKVTFTLPLFPMPNTPLDQIPSDRPRPEVDIQLSVAKPLFSDQELQECNLMSITVETLYSLPDGLTQPQPGATIVSYSAALPLPVAQDKNVPIVFAPGEVQPAPPQGQVFPPEPEAPKKFSSPGTTAQGRAQFIPNDFVHTEPYEQESGELKDDANKARRQEAESVRSKIRWNIERRAFLQPAGVKEYAIFHRLQDRISRNRYWPLEIFRILSHTTRGKKEEETVKGFHGVAYMNLAPLLYPGVKRIRGAFPVTAYSESEYREKVKLPGGLADEAVQMTNLLLTRGTSSKPRTGPGAAGEGGKGAKEGGKEGGGKEGGKNKGEKGGAAAGAAGAAEKGAQGGAPAQAGGQVGASGAATGQAPGAGQDGQPGAAGGEAAEAVPEPVNVEGQMYKEAQTYVLVEIQLNRPLVPRRQPEQLAKSVASYIPPRALFPKRVTGAQAAVDGYHAQVAQIASLVLQEFHRLYGPQIASNPAEFDSNPDATEQRRKELMYELNTSGKYFAFKEQLKYAVIKVVREKFLRTSPFHDEAELQAFLSSLYIYLTDEMHVALNRYVSLEDRTAVPEKQLDAAQLKLFAEEAAQAKDFALADKYYTERIARSPKNADFWFDYGVYCMGREDIVKAEQCFRECVAHDQRHHNGLILYGVCCAIHERNDEAELFLETATSFFPDSVVAWTTLGMFYDWLHNEIRLEWAMEEANRVNKEHYVHEQTEYALSRVPTLAAPDAASAAAAAAAGGGGAPDGQGLQPRADGEPASRMRSNLSNEPSKTPPVAGAGERPITHKSGRAQERAAESRGAERQTSPRGKSPGSPGHGSARGTHDGHSAAAGSRAKRATATSSSSDQKSRRASHASLGKAEEGTEAEVEQKKEEPPINPDIVLRSVSIQAAEFFLQHKALAYAERALAIELVRISQVNVETSDYLIGAARLHVYRAQFLEARPYLERAIQIDHQNPDAWALYGEVLETAGEVDAAKLSLERVTCFVKDASDMHAMYLRLARIYLDNRKFEDAKNMYLTACKRSASARSWLGVGISCYRLDELGEAEDALAEANVLNNEDALTWAYLSLVCLRTGRPLEAEQTFKYAIRTGLIDPNLLLEIENLQRAVGFGNPNFA